MGQDVSRETSRRFFETICLERKWRWLVDVIARALNALLMIAIPVVLGWVLARMFGVRWKLYLIGAVTFVAAQVLHIPFNQFVLLPWLESLGMTGAGQGAGLVLFGLIVGLSAGVFEETARYISYRTWAKEARTWEQGLMFGAGHGGIEAILLGMLAFIAFVQIMAIQGVDLSTVIPAEQLDLAEAQINAYWSLPWFGAMLGAVERVFAICIQLLLSLLVLQAFLRKNMLWFVVAILWHMLVNAVAVVGLMTWGIYWVEALVGVMAVVSLGGIFYLRGKMPHRPEEEEAGNPEGGFAIESARAPDEITKEILNKTRYTDDG